MKVKGTKNQPIRRRKTLRSVNPKNRGLKKKIEIVILLRIVTLILMILHKLIEREINVIILKGRRRRGRGQEIVQKIGERRKRKTNTRARR